MKIVPLADAKARLSAYVDECSTEGPLIITRNGKPVAVLLAPTDEEDLDRLMLARSPRFQSLLAKSRRSIAASKELPRDDSGRRYVGAVAARHERTTKRLCS